MPTITHNIDQVCVERTYTYMDTSTGLWYSDIIINPLTIPKELAAIAHTCTSILSIDGSLDWFGAGPMNMA